jgi:hypothetical protein
MILMASLAIVAPTVAFAEAVKVPVTEEPWQPKNATLIVEIIVQEGHNNRGAMFDTAQTSVPAKSYRRAKGTAVGRP